MKSDYDASEPLMSDEGDQTVRSRNDALAKRMTWAIIALAILYVPLLVGFYLIYHRLEVLQEAHPELMPLLGRRDGILEYELRKYSDYSTSPFAGDPREELEDAWHELFLYTNIRVDESDLASVNLSSLALADGSGYVAQPSVFHELHCIKRIRHWVYKDHYLPDISAHEYANWKGHIDHCLEMLRSAAMCRGDTALTTFHWLMEEGVPRPSAQDLGVHECVKWEPLVQWTKTNEVDLFDANILRKPDRQ